MDPRVGDNLDVSPDHGDHQITRDHGDSSQSPALFRPRGPEVPVAASEATGFLASFRLIFRASMMSMTWALCFGAAVSTTSVPATLGSIRFRRVLLSLSLVLSGSQDASAEA